MARPSGLNHALKCDASGDGNARLRLVEQSEVVGFAGSCVELAGCTGRAVRGYLRLLLAVGVLRDEREPSLGGVGDTGALLAPQHRRRIPEREGRVCGQN